MGFQSPKLSVILVVANFVLLRYPDRMHFSMAFLVICFFKRDLMLHARSLWPQIMLVRNSPLILHRLFSSGVRDCSPYCRVWHVRPHVQPNDND